MKRHPIHASLIAVFTLGASAAAQADIEISKRPTQNMNCNAGLCTPTAKDAVLNVTDLTNMLAGGDLTVQSGNGDGTAAGIEIDDSFSWTSTSRLTLDVKKSIVVKAPVTVAGTGALTLTCAKGNPAGDLLFEKKGKIDFWDTSSSLIINGNSYVLVSDIKTLAADINVNPSGFYALTKNYDASADGSYHASPVSMPFVGTFDGLGHAISHLTLLNHKNKGYYGLFYDLQTEAAVRNLLLVAVKMHCLKADGVGALAGVSSATVAHVSVDGDIISLQDAGGLFGQVSGTVVDAEANVSVSGNVAGGIAGYSATSRMIRNRTYGVVFGTLISGGLVGEGYGAAQSFSAATVAGGRDRLGGLIGGLNERGLIANSYATGPVRGGGEAGGIAGRIYPAGAIQASYAAGQVMSSGTQGGFVGRSKSAEYSNNYWDIDATGESIACGAGRCKNITGLSDAQLKSGLPEGFDPKIWGQSPNTNNGYPYLLANPPPK